ncbi:MAG: HTTM domain-containing protein [Bacteroidota bacterium]
MSRASLFRNIVFWASISTLICSIIVALSYFIGVHLNPQLETGELNWFFTGTFQEFRNWYPNYYLLLFGFAKGIIFLGVPLIFFFLAYASRLIRGQISQVYEWQIWLKEIIAYQPGTNLSFNLKIHLGGFLATLSTFLFFYFISKHLWPQLIIIQLSLARGFFLVGILLVFRIITVELPAVKDKIKDFLFEPCSPNQLAILRIICFGFFAIVCWQYPAFMAPYLELEIVPLPYMEWYTNLVQLSQGQYTIICKVGAIVNLMICIGMFSRSMLIINIPLIFIVIATPNFYGKVFHQHLWIWIPWIMAFSNCYHVWSIDSLIRKKLGKPYQFAQGWTYNFPIRMIWLIFGIIYFMPGFQKLWLGGFDWALSDSMLNQIYLEWYQHYDWRPFIRIDKLPWLIKFGGIMVILFELTYLIFLLFKSLRWVPIFGGILFHITTGLLMKIWFPPVLLMYIFYVNWDKVFSIKMPTFSASNRLFWFHPMIVTGFTLLVFNSIFGLLGIYSYPFSSFPGYSNIIETKIETLYIKGYQGNDQVIDINHLLKKENYRRENDTYYEGRIIEAWKLEANLNRAVTTYWAFLEDHVTSLKEIEKVEVYFQVVSIIPDKSGNPLHSEKIFEFVTRE